jgi:hypothetical protein
MYFQASVVDMYRPATLEYQGSGVLADPNKVWPMALIESLMDVDAPGQLV